MITIKSYTDLEQSRKLAEILPLESADMCYVIDYAESNKYGTDHFKLEVDTYGLKVQTRDNIPCYSLAALLGVLPEVNGVSVKMEKLKAQDGYEGHYYCIEYENIILIPYKTNPVDACYEMVIKLNELNLL